MRSNKQKIVLSLLLVVVLSSTSFAPNLSATDNASGAGKSNWSFWLFKTAGVVAAGYLVCRWSGLLDAQLCEAVQNGNLVLAKILIALGANVDAKGEYLMTSLLHHAAFNGHLDIVKFLVKRKADVDATNIYGETPLHWAASNGHLEVVKYLILNGADPNAVSVFGSKPADSTQISEIREYLVAASKFKTGTPLEVAKYVEKKLSVTDPEGKKKKFKFLCEVALPKADAPGRLYWIITDKFNKFNREQFGFTFKTPKEFYLYMLELYKQAPSKVLLDFCSELFRICKNPLTFGEISDNGNLSFDKQLTNKFEELFVPKAKEDNENKNNLGDKNKKSAENLDLLEKYGKIRELYNKNYRFPAELLTVLNNNKKFVDLKVTFKN